MNKKKLLTITAILAIFFFSTTIGSLASASAPTTSTGLSVNIDAVYSVLNKTAQSHNLRMSVSESTLVKDATSARGKLSMNNEFVHELELSSQSIPTIGAVYNYSSGKIALYFIMNWERYNVSYTAQWQYDVNSKVLQSDPVVYSSPALYNGPAISSETYSNQYHTNVNWAGYGFYLKGGFLNIYKQKITANAVNTNVVGIVMPPSNQVDYSVHQVATVWASIANGWQGNNGLAQTGYFRDATTNSGYKLFYEDYNSGVSNPQPMEYYPGNPTVSPNQILDITIQASGNNWDFSIDNYNTNTMYTVTQAPESSPYDIPAFTGYNAQYIVEAYSIGGVVQQIAELQSKLNFEAQTFYSNGAVRYATDMYNNGWFDQFTIAQNGNTVNIQPSYVMQYGTYYTNLYGYSQDTWQSSVY